MLLFGSERADWDVLIARTPIDIPEHFLLCGGYELAKHLLRVPLFLRGTKFSREASITLGFHAGRDEDLMFLLSLATK